MGGQALGSSIFGDRRRPERRARCGFYGWLELGIAGSALGFLGLMHVYPVAVSAGGSGRREQAVAWLTVVRVAFRGRRDDRSHHADGGNAAGPDAGSCREKRRRSGSTALRRSTRSTRWEPSPAHSQPGSSSSRHSGSRATMLVRVRRQRRRRPPLAIVPSVAGRRDRSRSRVDAGRGAGPRNPRSARSRSQRGHAPTDPLVGIGRVRILRSRLRGPLDPDAHAGAGNLRLQLHDHAGGLPRRDRRREAMRFASWRGGPVADRSAVRAFGVDASG